MFFLNRLICIGCKLYSLFNKERLLSRQNFDEKKEIQKINKNHGLYFRIINFKILVFNDFKIMPTNLFKKILIQ